MDSKCPAARRPRGRREPPPHVRAGATLCVRVGGATVPVAAAGRYPSAAHSAHSSPCTGHPAARRRGHVVGRAAVTLSARGNGARGTSTGRRALVRPRHRALLVHPLVLRSPPGHHLVMVLVAVVVAAPPLPRPIPPGCRRRCWLVGLPRWCGTRARAGVGAPTTAQPAGRVSGRPPRARQRGQRCRPVPPRCACVRERRGDQSVGSRARAFPRTGLPAWTAGAATATSPDPVAVGSAASLAGWRWRSTAGDRITG